MEIESLAGVEIMRWIVRFAICASLALASASKAHGGTVEGSESVVAALVTPAARSGKAAVPTEERRAALGLPLNGGTVSIRPSAREGRLVIGLAQPDVPTWSAEGADASGGFAFGEEERDNRTGLSYAVNKRVSLGLSYEQVTDETMMFEVAETGSLRRDYTSHNVFLQARWEF